MAPEPNDQKRRHNRFRVALPLKYRLLSSPAGDAPEIDFHNSHNLIYDLSLGGFLLSSKNFLEEGSLLEVEFLLKKLGKTYRGQALVVRANNFNYPEHGRFEYGLQFKEPEPPYRGLLDTFVKSISGEAP
jgi:hypothetical protein